MRLRDIKPCVTVMTVRLAPIFVLQRGRSFGFVLRVLSASRFSRLANAVIAGVGSKKEKRARSAAFSCKRKKYHQAAVKNSLPASLKLWPEFTQHFGFRRCVSTAFLSFQLSKGDFT